eukprot:4394426-Prymnesium_polylepis.1
MLAVFDTIDSSDDRRIQRSEFDAALPLLERWGAPVVDPEGEWRAMDASGGGQVLFDEFAGWAIERGLHASNGATLFKRAGTAGKLDLTDTED